MLSEQARRHVEHVAGPAAITLAVDGAAELREFLQRIRAFAASARGQAVRGYFEAMECADESVWDELQRTALPFDAPLMLIVDELYRLAPHTVEPGAGVTDDGRQHFESAL